MSARPVPRHIDAPNRLPEYIFTYIIVFYTSQFLFRSGFFSLTLTALALYMMYKYTLDKPEGLMMRMVHRHVQIGKMRPSPRFVRRFEI